MPTEKLRLNLSCEVISNMRRVMRTHDYRTQSVFIEEAIRFYIKECDLAFKEQRLSTTGTAKRPMPRPTEHMSLLRMPVQATPVSDWKERIQTAVRHWQAHEQTRLLRDVINGAEAYVRGAVPVVGIDSAMARFEIVDHVLTDQVDVEGVALDALTYLRVSTEDDIEEYWRNLIGCKLFNTGLSNSLGYCEQAAIKAIADVRLRMYQNLLEQGYGEAS